MSRRIYVLAFSIFLMSTGGYMAMPLFSLLMDGQDVTMVDVGSLTAIYIFMGKALPILSGPVADRAGHRRTAVIGEGIRGAGFLCLGLMHDFPQLFLCAALAGAGGGIASPALSAWMMADASEEERPFRSALRSTALNLGLLAGPALGGILLLFGQPKLIFMAAGLLYWIGAAGLHAFTSGTHSGRPNRAPASNPFAIYRDVWNNRRFLHLLVFMFVFWMLYAQLFVTLPIEARHYTRHIEFLFWINGILGLLLKYPLSRLMAKQFKAPLYLKVGVALFALSFILIGVWPGFSGLCAGIVCFTLGELFTVPVMETLIAGATKKDSELATYFGVADLANGIGRPVGSQIGPLLLLWTSRSVWWIFAFLAFGLLIYQRKFLYALKHENRVMVNESDASSQA